MNALNSWNRHDNWIARYRARCHSWISVVEYIIEIGKVKSNVQTSRQTGRPIHAFERFLSVFPVFLRMDALTGNRWYKFADFSRRNEDDGDRRRKLGGLNLLRLGTSRMQEAKSDRHREKPRASLFKGCRRLAFCRSVGHGKVDERDSTTRAARYVLSFKLFRISTQLLHPSRLLSSLYHTFLRNLT